MKYKGLTLSMGAILVSSIVTTPVLAEEAPVATIKSTGSITMKANEDPSNPENGGPLRIANVTDISFGEQIISGDDQVYAAKLTTEQDEEGNFLPDNIKIIDDRGSNQGWELQVKNDGFKSVDGTISLAATELTINPVSVISKSGNLLPSMLKSVILKNDGFKTMVAAKVNEGVGTTTTLFGEVAAEGTENSNVTLKIPGSSAKVKDTTYQTTLTWVLLDEPSAMFLGN
ncbi:WxL domain-containing protein [Vagococcus salmoninarum]|uniref:WxL domain-containing protein n=1 Tax=Vagococcus salmoninarum TaxID=2739 RepID=UPI0028D81373|nr:WxL domain-containing protein [Vagococcus salmoninarum]